jgi:ABC-type antimicrobial peptide transport system permease subunit
MISLKIAFRSVVRRPQQNIAVILGIALGVSLFVGVQVGSDSLGAGLDELTIHAIGERDAQIGPSFTPFILTQDIIEQEFSPILLNRTPLFESLQSTDVYDEYIAGMTERLVLTSTVLQPETGSIEVGQRLTGIDIEQDIVFGELFNQNGSKILISSLAENEIYIGEDVAEALFDETEDPIGKNLTIQTTLLTQSQPLMNISSIAVQLSLDLIIRDVFIDEGLGGEMFSNFLIMPLNVLQEHVVNAYDNAKLAAIMQGQIVLGYGTAPVTSLFIAWKDNVEIGDGSAEAIVALEAALEAIVGEVFIELFVVTDIRSSLHTQVELAADSLELLLNGFGAIIILAGILVIVNIQSMALASREQETGILRAVGAKKGQIIRLNLIEAVFLGIIGSVIGMGGGILYGRILIFFLGITFGFPSDLFPVVVELGTMVSSFMAGFVLSVLTGLFPAINASRINIARVLRGIDAPPKENFGRKSLYFGVILTITSFILLISLDPNPIIDGNEAFKTVDGLENSYLPIILLMVGPAILLAYYRNFRLGLSAVGLSLLGWAYFNIFYAMDQLEISGPSGDSNGLLYILYLAGSLLIGSVIVMAVNLGALAGMGQKIASWFARSSTTPIRGTTMVAFRKMRSKVSRSTLTFALFATILTLNIWIGTFSYSFRYGLDSQTQAMTAGSELIVYTPDNVMPISLDYSQKLINEFGDTSADTYITDVRGFLVSSTSPFYTNNSDPASVGLYKAVSVAPNSFWATEEQLNWIFPFDLADNKTGTPFENGEPTEETGFSIEATIEDETVWKAIANNETIPNKEGYLRPVIASTFIFTISEEGFELGPAQGDSVFLNLTDGTLQEFVIGAVSSGSPLSDYANTGPSGGSFGGGGGGFSGLAPTFYVSEGWKDKLFASSGFGDSENIFIVKTNAETDSDELAPLLLEIEKWSNAGDFKDEYGLYGVIGLTTYSIYEAQLESGFQFFQFLQAYVSLGFAVGILGLLVVASRSVAERKREIGMLRALGFRRKDIVVSVVLELIVLGMIGLFLGFINGVIMGYALTNIFGGMVQFQIPWNTIIIYGLITLFSAIFAAIIPAIRASNIPASDALRYTG